MKICQAVINLWSGHETIVNTQRAITPKVEKPELWFMCSACLLVVFNVCVKFMKICPGVLKLWSGQENC